MSKCYEPKQWCLLAVGIGMLSTVVFVGFLCLGNEIGFGKALAAIVFGGFIATWLVVGVVCIVRSLNKM